MKRIPYIFFCLIVFLSSCKDKNQREVKLKLSMTGGVNSGSVTLIENNSSRFITLGTLNLDLQPLVSEPFYVEKGDELFCQMYTNIDSCKSYKAEILIDDEVVLTKTYNMGEINITPCQDGLFQEFKYTVK